MRKNVLLGALGLIVLVVIGLSLWVRAVFTEDNVRTTLAEQLSKAIGQPVTIGSISATIFPRVTVNLRQVGIGMPANVDRAKSVGLELIDTLAQQIDGVLELERDGGTTFTITFAPSLERSLLPT